MFDRGNQIKVILIKLKVIWLHLGEIKKIIDQVTDRGRGERNILQEIFDILKIVIFQYFSDENYVIGLKMWNLAT